MTERFILIKKIQENQKEIQLLSSQMTPSYNPIGGHRGLDPITYQRYGNQIAELNNRIYELKNIVVKLPKENNNDDLKLKAELMQIIKSDIREKEVLQGKINNCKDWGLDNLRLSLSKVAARVEHAEVLLSLL